MILLQSHVKLDHWTSFNKFLPHRSISFVKKKVLMKKCSVMENPLQALVNYFDSHLTVI